MLDNLKKKCFTIIQFCICLSLLFQLILDNYNSILYDKINRECVLFNKTNNNYIDSDINDNNYCFLLDIDNIFLYSKLLIEIMKLENIYQCKFNNINENKTIYITSDEKKIDYTSKIKYIIIFKEFEYLELTHFLMSLNYIRDFNNKSCIIKKNESSCIYKLEEYQIYLINKISKYDIVYMREVSYCILDLYIKNICPLNSIFKEQYERLVNYNYTKKYYINFSTYDCVEIKDYLDFNCFY